MYKIMVVEDNKTLADNVADTLVRWGYEASIVADFEQIFQQCIKEKPHLILMDVNLPYYDGFYWCSKIREHMSVPIIFLSSRDSNMDVIMAINTGADDYITKPFSMDILTSKINALIRRTYSYMGLDIDIIEHDGVILNVEEATLTYKEHKLELTKHELKILNLLIKNKGKIISRDRIINLLWESDEFISDNTLTVNINRLRNKLKEIELENLITTKKGQGYTIL